MTRSSAMPRKAEGPPTPVERLISGMKEALAIAEGEQPAAGLFVDGHHYVPREALKDAEAEIERLRIALMRIAFKDRHGRLVRPNENGGFRGVGGMIATYALTGVNGSFVGDEHIAEKFPEIAAAIRKGA